MIKVRFAPSPTGYLHIGNARAALINYLFAKKNKGFFLLRMDDTDMERSEKRYEDAIVEDLKWLGIHYDQVCHQSHRFDRYEVVKNILIASGDLYPCYDTKEELEFKRKRCLSQKKPPIYDRSALQLTKDQIQIFEQQGRKPHYRFLLKDQPICWNDGIKRIIEFDGKDLSDPVLIREDGVFLYSFCSVIDDIDFGITHVIRGEDHVTNTATQIQMFEALGGPIPHFSHTTLLLDKDGSALSKRLGSLSLKDLRDKGIEPLVMNSLLSRLGTSLPMHQAYSMDELIQGFDLSYFTCTAPKFNDQDLVRMNEKYFHHVPFDHIQSYLKDHDVYFTEDEFEIVKKNVTSLKDFKIWYGILKSPITRPAQQSKDQDFLKIAIQLLPTEFSKDTWRLWTQSLGEHTKRKGYDLYHPLRQALTGLEYGPKLEDLFLLLTPSQILERLNECLKC
jgi:glutamyl-tRNA synthetase